MDKHIYEPGFNEEEQTFTGEEITTFKRYIEENNVTNENNFEFLEENLSYYSSRYTNEHYSSPSEVFQCNSNFIRSDEMGRNYQLFLQSVEWSSKTVHPEDSEYVIKKEKYIFIDELGEFDGRIIDHLNKYPKEDYQCCDILIYHNGDIYKYLPYKNFIFKWRKKCRAVAEELMKFNFYQDNLEFEGLEEENPLIIFPIFVPIRRSLFLGEYGYRSAMVKYGQIIERLVASLSNNGQVHNIEMFDNYNVNKLLGLDGIEKSIFNIIVYK